MIQIQFRRGNASQWTSANPTLAQGEMGLELDTDKFKIGDGLTPWSSLDYGGIAGPSGPNNITTSTATSINAILKGNGTNVQSAVAGTDYVLPSAVYTKTEADALLAAKFNVPIGTTLQYVRGDGSIATFPTTLSSNKMTVEVSNQSGSLIAKGSVVYINGTHGNLPTIALSQANSEANSTKTFGIVENDISSGSNGLIIKLGLLENLNTFGITEGVTLWLSPTVAGGYTTTKPSAPNHAVVVGVCTRAHPTLGTIIVSIQNGYELEELHNVAISSIQNGQVIKYNSATSLWENYTLTKSDVGLSNVPNTDTTNPSNITQDSTHRFVTDSEKSTWNGKQDSLGFTPENVSNKSISVLTDQASNTKYPSVKSVYDWAISAFQSALGFTPENVANKATSLVSPDNTKYPTTQAVATGLSSKQDSLGFTPENVTNKSTNLTSPDNTKYPTTQAVATGLSGKQDSLGFTPENVSNKENTTLDTSSTKYPTNNLVKTYVDSGLSGKQNSLGFTPENVANKETTALDTSTTKYPANSVVKTAVDAKANLSGGNSFTGTQSFGDGAVNRFSADLVTITSFPYALQASDNGKILRFNASVNSQVDLPNSLPAGFNVAWSQSGAGTITFAPAVGATMNNRQTHTKSAGQHAMGSLVIMTNSGTNAMYNLAGDTQA